MGVHESSGTGGAVAVAAKMVVVARLLTASDAWTAQTAVGGRFFVPKKVALNNIRIEAETAGSGTISVIVHDASGAQKSDHNIAFTGEASKALAVASVQILETDYITIDMTADAQAPSGFYVEMKMTEVL